MTNMNTAIKYFCCAGRKWTLWK